MIEIKKIIVVVLIIAPSIFSQEAPEWRYLTEWWFWEYYYDELSVKYDEDHFFVNVKETRIMLGKDTEKGKEVDHYIYNFKIWCNGKYEIIAKATYFKNGSMNYDKENWKSPKAIQSQSMPYALLKLCRE